MQILKKYKSKLEESELSEALAIASRFTQESTEWITLAQSMDLLFRLKKRLKPDSELKLRVVELTSDSRKAVASKAKKLIEVLP